MTQHIFSDRISRILPSATLEMTAKAAELKRENQPVYNMSVGEPDFPTPKNIQEAAIKAIKDGYHGYTPSNGILILREAISEMIYSDYKANISPENILITPGGKPTIFFCSLNIYL